MVIFAVILVYVVICVIAYFNARHIVGYEVKEGSLSSNHIYNHAFVVRSEDVIEARASGYVNYFAAEGARVGTGGLVYTIDGAGGLKELMMAEGTDTISLSASDYSEIRSQIVQFASSFRPRQYNTVYDFKYALQGTAQKLTNARILESMEALNDARIESIGYYTAPKSGVVVYSADGYETLAREDVTAQIMEENNYERTMFLNNALVQEGDPVYKIIDDENWCVVIQTDEETAKALEAEEYVRIRFLKNQDESWGRVETFLNRDGEQMVAFYFTNSMITFCTDRYLGIELLLQEQKGLKVPNTAIVEKNFYLVDTAYVTTGTDGSRGVMRRTYTENGEEQALFTSTQIYYEQDGSYYIDMSQLSPGDLLYKPGTQETMTVGAQATLTGVYNINKGFADFRQISVLYANDEYSIVESGTMYGLSVYDHIVLDASTVSEDELIYD